MSNKKRTTKKNPSTLKKILRIALAIVIPLGGGLLVSLLTINAMSQFNTLKQPPLAPPAWLFPVAWTILYILMGVASYLIYRAWEKGKKAEKHCARIALMLYGVQLVFNFIWTPIFFNLGLYWVAFAVLMIMWVLEVILLAGIFRLSRGAFWCLLPYLLWTTFAAYLNVAIAILN